MQQLAQVWSVVGGGAVSFYLLVSASRSLENTWSSSENLLQLIFAAPPSPYLIPFRPQCFAAIKSPAVCFSTSTIIRVGTHVLQFCMLTCHMQCEISLMHWSCDFDTQHCSSRVVAPGLYGPNSLSPIQNHACCSAQQTV